MHTLQWPTTPGHKWHLTTPTTTALLTCLPTLLMTFRWAALQDVSLFSSKVKSTQSAGLLGLVFLSFTPFHFLVPAENTKIFLPGIGPWQCSLFTKAMFYWKLSLKWRQEGGLAACLPPHHLLVEITLKIGTAPGIAMFWGEAKPGVQVLNFIRPTAVSERNRWAFGNKLFELLKTWCLKSCFVVVIFHTLQLA